MLAGLLSWLLPTAVLGSIYTQPGQYSTSSLGDSLPFTFNAPGGGALPASFSFDPNSVQPQQQAPQFHAYNSQPGVQYQAQQQNQAFSYYPNQAAAQAYASAAQFAQQFAATTPAPVVAQVDQQNLDKYSQYLEILQKAYGIQLPGELGQPTAAPAYQQSAYPSATATSYQAGNSPYASTYQQQLQQQQQQQLQQQQIQQQQQLQQQQLQQQQQQQQLQQQQLQQQQLQQQQLQQQQLQQQQQQQQQYQTGYQTTSAETYQQGGYQPAPPAYLGTQQQTHQVAQPGYPAPAPTYQGGQAAYQGGVAQPAQPAYPGGQQQPQPGYPGYQTAGASQVAQPQPGYQLPAAPQTAVASYQGGQPQPQPQTYQPAPAPPGSFSGQGAYGQTYPAAPVPQGPAPPAPQSGYQTVQQPSYPSSQEQYPYQPAPAPAPQPQYPQPSYPSPSPSSTTQPGPIPSYQTAALNGNAVYNSYQQGAGGPPPQQPRPQVVPYVPGMQQQQTGYVQPPLPSVRPTYSTHMAGGGLETNSVVEGSVVGGEGEDGFDTYLPSPQQPQQPLPQQPAPVQTRPPPPQPPRPVATTPRPTRPPTRPPPTTTRPRPPPPPPPQTTKAPPTKPEAAGTSVQAITQQIRKLPAVLYVDSRSPKTKEMETLLRDTYGLPLVSFYVDKIDRPKLAERNLQQLTAHKGLPYLFICGTFIGSEAHIDNYHKNGQIPQLVEYVCGDDKKKKKKTAATAKN